MSERYLFRGKRADNGEWVRGACCPNDGYGKASIILVAGVGAGAWITVYPATVGQCTGLRDRNGKLVFEGDIARLLSQDHRGNDYDECVTVRWSADVHGWVGMNDALKRDDMYAPLASHDNIEVLEVEVIGNTHDNPELLGREV